MTTITTSLPEQLVQQLDVYAKKLQMPKNKFIEKALSTYLDHLKKAEYVRSYKMAGAEADIMKVAEEGMKDYLDQMIEAETK